MSDNPPGSDFFDLYFEHAGVSEVPLIFHRWTAIGVIGALLSRNVYITFGHSRIYPNQYVLLTGGPGSRKGTAIRIGKDLAIKAGYKTFAPNRAAKEAMWHQMAHQHDQQIYDLELTIDPVTDMFIAQDEFVDFIGVGNDELITNLTNLWDNLDEFRNPKMTKEDVIISKPTINILSGSAPGTLNEAFNSLALSGGFFSRILFIYGGYSPLKVTWPSLPSPELQTQLVEHLKSIRELGGEVVLTPKVKNLLDLIYKNSPGVSDRRFAYYSQRRFTHLLKLVIIMSAAQLRLEPNEEDVLRANTVLHLAELKMPYALGEYGKSKFSDVANGIMDIIKASDEPVTAKGIWKQVSQDLDKFTALVDILQNLLTAGKIQQAKKNGRVMGYLPVIEISSKWDTGLINYNLVRADEHPMEQPGILMEV